MLMQLKRQRQPWQLRTLLLVMIETKKIFRPCRMPLVLATLLIRVQHKHPPFKMRVNTLMSLEMMSARKKWWTFVPLSTRSKPSWWVGMARRSSTKDLLLFKKTNRLSCQKLMESSRSLSSSTPYSTAQMTVVVSLTTAPRIFLRKT